MNIGNITAAALKEADEAARGRGEFKLNVPESAKTNSKNPRQKFWTEYGRVLSAKMYQKPGKSGFMHTIFEIKIEIGANGSGENFGTKVTFFPRIAFDSFKLDATNGDRIMSVRSSGLIEQFLTAFGIECKDENGDIKSDVLMQVFTPEGGDSPVVGNEIAVEIKQTAPEEGVPGSRWQVEAATFMEA